MRILFWTPFFLPNIGGIETLVSRLMPKLQTRGHEIMLIASHGYHQVPDETLFGDIPVYFFHFRQAIGKNRLPQLLRIRSRISELKKSFRPDVVHLHMSDPSVYFHLSTRAAHPAPMLLSMHGMYHNFTTKIRKDSLFERAFLEAGWVTGVSKMVLAESKKLMPAITDKSSVVYNGLEPLSRTPCPLSFTPPHIFCSARLVPQKALHHAIDAFALVREEFPDALMTIAGDGILRDELERQVAGLGMGKTVKFLGEVAPEEMSHYMEAATIVLLSSDTEGLPMVVLEAGQMARPVVSTKVGGVAEAVIHGETGFLVEPGSSQVLAKAVIELLTQPAKAQRMGNAARQHIQEKFSLEACTDAYEKLYMKLVGQFNGD